MVNQTDVLQPYKPANFPADQKSQQRYLPEQDQRIANCLNQIIQVMKALEAKVTTVSGLPAASASQGLRRMVTDATAVTFQSIVAGGGTNIVPVYCDGTNWRIG